MVSYLIFRLWLLGLLLPVALRAQSFDVQHYHIALDINLAAKTLSGHTRVQLRSQLKELLFVELSLYQLKVKQVLRNGQRQRFEQSADRLFVELLSPAYLGDTLSLDISYEGKPAAPSWFGGFYMTDTSAYNLGVWIDGTPPNFGKAWFPCVDNFMDKATYSYAITTPRGYTAVCGGMHQGTTPAGKDKLLHRWALDLPIASYLASVAVGRYSPVTFSLTSVSGRTVPAYAYVHPAEVAAAETHFRGLQEVFSAFEAHFGPYQWPRVGYVAVAMKGGAMEHAVNIAYPESGLTDPGIALWVHELAHSWFGNLVTCKDASEMWLNEGFARYCETLGQYAWLRIQEPGTDPRLLLARLQDEEIQARVLALTHRYDGGYFPVSGVPAALTYSSTVYDKGATVVHTLRYFLGDSVFFPALQAYLRQYAWGNAGSQDLQKALTAYSRIDLAPFFEGWVYSPGFPHYRIADTLQEQTAQGRRLRLVLEQTLWHKPVPVLHSRLPVWLCYAGGQQELRQLEMIGEQDTVWLDLPATVTDVWLDPFNQVGDARTGTLARVTSRYARRSKELAGYLEAEVAAGDTAWVRLQRHWGAPPRLSLAANGNWWSVDILGKATGKTVLVYNQEDRPKDIPRTARPAFYHKADLRSPWQKIADVPFGRTEYVLEYPLASGYYAIAYTE
ncbi:MAG: M1 family metallopeptidase [Bacteroidetes bacterium]|nr:M1 family metallopeptidase [Bacteroidota bacterium]